MILELFIVLCIISLTLIILGYFTDDSHYAYVGLFFFFLLGIYIFSNQLQFRSGDIANVTFVNNGSIVLSSSTITTYTYNTFTDAYSRWFGVLLSVAAGAGMSLIWFNYRRKKNEET